MLNLLSLKAEVSRRMNRWQHRSQGGRSHSHLLPGLTLVIAGATAWAQTVPAPPPGANVPQPGRLTDLEQQLRRSGPQQDQSGRPGGSVLEPLQLEDSARPRPESRANVPSFVLQSLRIIGNTVLDEAAIAEQVRNFVGKPVTSADLQEMAARVTRLYAQRGYVTSRCVVPAQRVDNGNVVLQIEEDRLGNVQIAGATSYRYDMRVFIDQVNDLRGQLLNGPELESRLRLVARIPGARVKPSLRKSAFGVTDLILEISDLPNTGTVAITNDGNRLTSTNRISASRTFNNPTGNADVLAISTTVAPSTQYFGGVNAQYQLPVGSAGGRLLVGMSGLYYRLDPAAVGNNAIRYEGGSTTTELTYEQPFKLTPPNTGALWSLGFERRDVRAATIYNTVFDKPAGYKYVDGQDKLFVLAGTMKFERFGDWFGLRGQTAGSIGFKRALPGWFGSMNDDAIANKRENLAANLEPITGPIGDVRGMRPDFLKFYASIGRAQTLPKAFLLQGTLEGEWTDARRVPQTYEFAGADNGASGLRANLLINRPLGDSGVTAGLGYTWARAISYFRDAAGGGSPACQTSPGVYEARFQGRNECTVGYPYITLSYRGKRFYGDLNLGDLPFVLSGQEKLKFNAGMVW